MRPPATLGYDAAMHDSRADAFGLLFAAILLALALMAVYGLWLGLAFAAIVVLAPLYCSWRRIL